MVSLRRNQPPLHGTVLAGPTCPVQHNPPDPACADRPVIGAEIVVTNLAGDPVAHATTAADGSFQLELPPGTYVLQPQPVPGLLGTPAPQQIVVGAGPHQPHPALRHRNPLERPPPFAGEPETRHRATTNLPSPA